MDAQRKLAAQHELAALHEMEEAVIGRDEGRPQKVWCVCSTQAALLQSPLSHEVLLARYELAKR